MLKTQKANNNPVIIESFFSQPEQQDSLETGHFQGNATDREEKAMLNDELICSTVIKQIVDDTSEEFSRRISGFKEAAFQCHTPGDECINIPLRMHNSEERKVK